MRLLYTKLPDRPLPSAPAPPPTAPKARAGAMSSAMFKFKFSDQSAWYVGPMSRKEAQTRLHGIFLVCGSPACPEDGALSMSENSQVSHYIVNSLPNHHFKIGDLEFDCLLALLRVL